ncbi:MetQ/NlpA family ABC transporter substrate-binding protein [Campylobacter sp. US33a]|uniref:MetQ/NlpA family ABC transporter substrate-binding protein n=1 Tax=Campylobacter sp. US33a TaxID=2498120 RepID=UPI0010688D19|nr:MetQ/NlpA family ABC transporter substrate-binding protein [Campylobacter sp. US33a]TEY01603.1 MetQ/NlpA family ABC transporter substrate-binding protein [Campylobacter sp. US33a]
MKWIKIALLFLLTLSLKADDKIITIGATPVPYAQILEFSKPLFKARGYELKIVEFSDYITPNLALNEGELDANLYQHKAFMEEFNTNKGTKLVASTPVVLPPMGVYSKKYTDLKQVPQNAIIAIPNDPTNEGRALELLEQAGLITLSKKANATPLDITQNPKNIQFKELKAAQLPRALGDVDFAVINSNYALGANLMPKDALFLESKDSPFVNHIVVHESQKNSEKTKIINEVIHSKEFKDHILKAYKDILILAI